MSRLLVIVAREELARYASLKHIFASESADVLLDRRRGERRRGESPTALERRRGDRRVRNITPDLQTLGWALVRCDVETSPASPQWAWSPGMEPVRVRVEILFSLLKETDVVAARERGRDMAARIGLSPADSAIVATAVSELARNIVAYAGRGEVILRSIASEREEGIEVVAVDTGPGITDVERALRDGYSTSGGFGLGLPGVRRLMDAFHIASEPGKGTAVTVRKWRRLARGA